MTATNETPVPAPESGVRWQNLALAALLAGAAGIAFAPIFVRLSEIGPSATAFHRLFLALPLLLMWTRFEGPANGSGRRPGRKEAILLVVAGLVFAADLAFWHWSILLTSVANATLLANFAPVFVTLGAWLILKERISARFMAALAVSLAGTAVLVGTSFEIDRQHVIGDGLGIITAVFYGGWLLTVKQLRATLDTGTILFWSGLVAAAALLPVALISGESLFAPTLTGWMILLGLAWLCHCCGQGLIAQALAHLPASFSSLVLMLQPVVSALLAWAILSEPLQPLQAAGGLVVLFGIMLARGAVREAQG